MSVRYTPPQNTIKAKGSDCDSLTLSSAAFGSQVRRCSGLDSADGVSTKNMDEVGPHIEFLQAFGGVARSYLPTRAGEPRSPHEQRFKELQERVNQRINVRGAAGNVPKDAPVVDLRDVLASQTRTGPIENFKQFLDRAGVVPGKTSYLTLPDGTVSAVRRRILDNTAAANEVVWVETFAAVGHLHNLKCTDRGADLVLPIPYDIRGFFDPEVRIAVVPMIDKRNGRSRSEWRAESLAILEIAAHELEHGRGGGEYQARSAGDSYLYRAGVMPTVGDPGRRLEAISLGWYRADEYAAAVGDAMRDLKVPTIIAPARLPDSRVEDVPTQLLASVSVGAFASEEALSSGEGADVLSYGLTMEGAAHDGGRRVCARHEDGYAQMYRMVGEPLLDRILQEASAPEHLGLRIVVAQAISHRIAHESLKMAKILQVEKPTSGVIGRLADSIAAALEPGDVHVAVREYVRSRGGAAVLPHGQETMWINALPEGITLRSADSITIFFASPIHQGAALRIPMHAEYSSQLIAERVRAFERDAAAIVKLFARRPGRSLWESVAVPQVAKGARYLLPALEGAQKK
jgi:hypothetical protein